MHSLPIILNNIAIKDAFWCVPCKSDMLTDIGQNLAA